jgi:hypothetical protein
VLLDLGFLTLLALASAGIGLRALRLFGPAPEHPADSLALALPLGLGTLGLIFLGIAEIGMLNPTGILATSLAGLLIGGRDAIRLTRAIIRTCLSSRWLWAWDLPLVATLVGTFLTALGPVTDGDALCYHLQVPKMFLAGGSVGFDPDLHETVYPLLTEMLYAMALALRGPVACRLVQWLLGVCFALNVAAMARPFLGDRARWAATVALLVPAVSNGMGAPLNDVALAAFGNAAIFAWTRWRVVPGVGSAALVGVLAGMALGVKYPALVLTAVIAAAMLCTALAGPGDARLRRSREAVLFGLIALAVGGAWYLRAYIHTGNPVHPFFRHIFGGAGFDEVLDPIKRPLAASAWNLATALVPMTLDPARFDSVSHQFGPVFLLVLPALLWERAPRRLWAIVAIGYAFLTLCLTQRQSMRFVLTAVGPMAVGVAWIASLWWDRKTVPARLLAVLLVTCLGFESTIALGRARHGLKVVLGRESAEEFLTRREPTYRVGRWIDGHLPPTARIIGQDHRGYYIPRAYAMELAHRRRTGLGTHGESSEAIVSALQTDGFTHVLLCPPEPLNAVEFDPALDRLLGNWLEGRDAVYRETIADPDGVVRRYAIYELGGGSHDAIAARPRERPR